MIPGVYELAMSTIIAEPKFFGSASKRATVDYNGKIGFVTLIKSTNKKGFEILPVMWADEGMLKSELEEEQLNLFLTMYFNQRGVKW